MGFFSSLIPTGKQTQSHDDLEAAGGNHNKHEQSRPQKNFFGAIFGKPKHQEEAGASHDDEHHAKQDNESHPTKKNLFGGIFGKTKHQEEAEQDHKSHPAKKNFFAEIFGEHHHEEGHDQHNPPHFLVKTLHRIELFLRIATLGFLVAGIVVLALNEVSNITTSSNGNSVASTLKFLHLASYKYIFGAIIISQTYITIQIIFSTCRLVTGAQRGFIMRYFDFVGDKILTYFLATGAAAAYGASIDMEISGNSSYLNQGKTAASLVLIAFFFSAISSVISSHSLPKHPLFL